MTDTPRRTAAATPAATAAAAAAAAATATGTPHGPDSAVDTDRVFAALADPRRRELLELLGLAPGCSASSLAARLPVSRQAVAQHLAVLEDSRLVSRRRAGREVLFSVRTEGLAATAEWLTCRAAAWRERIDIREEEAEQRDALTAPPITRRMSKTLH